MSGRGGEGWKEKTHGATFEAGHIKLLKGNYRVESCVTALLTSSMGNVLSRRRSPATIEKRLQLNVLENVSIS